VKSSEKRVPGRIIIRMARVAGKKETKGDPSLRILSFRDQRLGHIARILRIEGKSSVLGQPRKKPLLSWFEKKE